MPGRAPCLTVERVPSAVAVSHAPDGPRFQRYVRALRSRLHDRLSGRHGAGGSGDLVGRFAALARPDAIARDRQLARSGTDQACLARLRLHHRVALAIQHATAAHADRLQATLAVRTCTVQGRRIRFLDLPAALRTSRAAATRRAIMAAENAELRALAPAIAELWRRRGQAARAVERRGYLPLFAECRDFDARCVCRTAQHLLRGTDATYAAALARWAPRVLGTGTDAVAYSDVAWLLRGDPWTSVFAGRIRPAVTRFIAAWAGERARAIRLDCAERSRKSARPYAAPLDPPRLVWLVARPSGSPRDLEELLHEAGHAVAFAAVRRRLRWEARLLSFDDVAETFAFLSGRLVCSSRFLVDRVGLGARAAHEYASYAAFVELLMVRRYCAKVLFECAHDDPGADAPEYAALIERAIAARPDPARAWWETDEELASVDYLRAWLLEAALRAYLVREHGEAWFESTAAIGFLRSLWSKGGVLDGAGLAAVIGVERLSIEPLLASCREGQVAG